MPFASAAPYLLTPAQRAAVVSSTARAMIATAGERINLRTLETILDREVGGAGFPSAEQIDGLQAAASARYRAMMAEFAQGAAELA